MSLLRAWRSTETSLDLPDLATATAATSATEQADHGPPVAVVATVAVATPRKPESEGVGEPDFSDGWRRRLATEQWHKEWSGVWRGWKDDVVANPGWYPPSRYELEIHIINIVRCWNVATGDSWTSTDYRAQLTNDDYSDRELMTPGWIALYCWTIFHDPAIH